MKNILIAFLTLLSIILVCCKENKKKFSIEVAQTTCNTVDTGDFSRLRIKSYKFEKTFKLNLDDSLIVNNQTLVQYDKNSNSLFLLDNQHKRLLSYDLTTKEINHRIFFKGKRGKIIPISAFSYVNDSNIVVYNYAAKKIYFADAEGRVNSSYKLTYPVIGPKNLYHGYPSAYVTNGSPIIRLEDNVYFTGYLFGEHEKDDYKNRFLRIKFNVKSKKTEFDINYSDTYFNGNWGGDYFRIPYATLLPNGKQVISLPAEHHLLVADPKGNLETKYATDSKSKFCISSIPIPKNDMISLDNDTIAHIHYSTSYSYKDVVSLAKQNLIVRFLELPLKKTELNKYGAGKKKVELLIFDQSLSFLGKIMLAPHLSSSNYFVTDKGIYFLNNSNKNEYEAHYELFSLQTL